MTNNFYKLFNSKYFFLCVIFFYVVFHLIVSYSFSVGDLSSDIWMVQYVMTQQQELVWEHVPPFYNQEKFYLAYPFFYFLNPGLENSLFSYHLVMVFLIILTYLVTGFVFKKIFGSWLMATFGALLFLIPHFIFPTRFGLLGFQNFRGVGFSFVFYALLSYYWIIFGIEDRKKNILLGVVAAFSVYVYPPFGVILVPIFIFSAFLIKGKTKLLSLLIFTSVYLIGSSLFWYGHFSNPDSGMIDSVSLSAEELKLQSEIISYRIPDTSLRGMDFGVIKRSIWDGGFLFVFFLASLFLFNKVKFLINKDQRNFFWVSIVVGGVLLLFIFSIEAINWFRFINELPPVFIEHWRLMRLTGFLLVGQSVFVVFCLGWIKGYKFWAGVIMILLICTPLVFSAPLIRFTVRSFVPEEVREKYNLAPIPPASSTKSFENLQDIAIWSRNNLNSDDTKIFVFNEFQKEFIFKVISRHETNLTTKEGSIWVTSGFENSLYWYKERINYEKNVDGAFKFSEILDFANSLNSTHMLIPRGKYEDLFVESGVKLNTIYKNYDYRLVEL